MKAVKGNLSKNLLEELTAYNNNKSVGLVQLEKRLPIPGHNSIHTIARNNPEINKETIKTICTYDHENCWGVFQPSYKLDFGTTLTWHDPPGPVLEDEQDVS